MKKCPKCGKELDDGIKICPECGTDVSTSNETSEGESVPNSPNEQADEEGAKNSSNEQAGEGETQEESKKSSGQGKGIVVAIVVVLLAVVIFLVYREQQRKSTYNEAVALLEAEEYTEAEELFLTIPNYKDTADYLVIIDNQKSYEQAVALFEEESYEEAEDIFNTISDYKDTADYLDQIAAIRAYREAYALYEQGEYEDALQVIDGITIYEPVQELRQTMEYELTYNSYLSAVSSYELMAQTEAVETQKLLKQLYRVWYNCIYKVENESTDAYTRDASGEFFADFNTALAAYRVSDEYDEIKNDLMTLQEETQTAYSDLQNAAQDLEEIAEKVDAMQSALTALDELALNPTGSLSTFSSQAEELTLQFTEADEALKEATPQMLSMNRDSKVNEEITDLTVSTVSYQLAVASSNTMNSTAGKTLFADFLTQYTVNVGEDIVIGSAAYTGTQDQPYGVVVFKTEADKTEEAQALAEAFVSYVREEEPEEVTDQTTAGVIASNDEGITAIYFAEETSAVQDVLSAAGLEVKTTYDVLTGNEAEKLISADEEQSELIEGETEVLSEVADGESGESVAEFAGTVSLYEPESEESISESVSESVSETSMASQEEMLSEGQQEEGEESVAEQVGRSEMAVEEPESVSEAITTLTAATEALSEAIERVSEAQEALSEAMALSEEETQEAGGVVTAEDQETETEQSERSSDDEREAVTEAAEVYAEAEQETETTEDDALYTVQTEAWTEAMDGLSEEIVEDETLTDVQEETESLSEGLERDEAQADIALDPEGEMKEETDQQDESEEEEILESVAETVEEPFNEDEENETEEETEDLTEEGSESVEEWSSLLDKAKQKIESDTEEFSERLSEIFGELSTEKQTKRAMPSRAGVGALVQIKGLFYV